MTTRGNHPLRRQNTEAQLTMTVKYDYSETYFDNADLDADLEEQTDILGKEMYKATLDSHESLEIAKKGADEMLSLRDAVRKREPDDSINKVAMTGGYKSSFAKKESCRKARIIEEENNNETQNTNGNFTSEHATTTQRTDEKNKTDSKPKLSNTLTMFLLSLHKLKGLKNNPKEPQKEKSASEKREEQILAAQKTNFMRHGVCPLTDEKKTRKKRAIRPATAGVVRTERTPSRKGANRAPSAPIYTMRSSDSMYGIKNSQDPTRSRRTLEQISKIDHDAKFGYVDMYEVRRRKLLAVCKDTEVTDNRIKVFLKNIDDFKKATCPDNSLDKVLNKINTGHGYT